jgi:hypothetical protein
MERMSENFKYVWLGLNTHFKTKKSGVLGTPGDQPIFGTY